MHIYLARYPIASAEPTVGTNHVAGVLHSARVWMWCYLRRVRKNTLRNTIPYGKNSHLSARADYHRLWVESEPCVTGGRVQSGGGVDSRHARGKKGEGETRMWRIWGGERFRRYCGSGSIFFSGRTAGGVILRRVRMAALGWENWVACDWRRGSPEAAMSEKDGCSRV